MDFTDGCDEDFTIDPTSDEDIAGFVLFADIDPLDKESIEKRIHDWNLINGA